jgi:putative alpha-1,2-mannosidase
MDNTDNVVETDEVVDVKVSAEAISQEQEVAALRRVHQFLSEFDRVPGSMSAQWSQMLDTVAIVANSLIAKLPKTGPQEEETKE